MRRTLFAAILAAALVVLAVGATSASSGNARSSDGPKAVVDNLPGPLAQKQIALRKRALELQLTGKISANAKVAQVAGVDGRGYTGKDRGQFVELARRVRTRSGRCSSEFGTAAATHNHGALGNIDQPVRRPAAQPDPAARSRGRQHARSGPRTSARSYYKNLLFSEAPGASSMRNFYIEDSSNRYAVNGDGHRLGARAVQRGRLRRQLLRQHRLRPRHQRLFVRDRSRPGTTGRSPPARRRRRSTRICRSSTCGIATTTTATATSTSRTATSTTSRRCMPARARRPAAARRAPTRSGAIAGTRSTPASARPARRATCSAACASATRSYWVGDYTVEPENGGVGVFAHEFGHDLGLPDLYDTSGNTGGAENSTGFWTIVVAGLVRQRRHAGGRHRQPPDLDERVGEAPARLVELPGRQPGRPARRKLKLGPTEPTTRAGAGGRRASCPTSR